jgi:Protein of unknown function (DUF3800)
MSERFAIFCDESTEKGEFYSHFYGGALLRERDRVGTEKHLAAVKQALNITGEMKWTKISLNYADKYIEFVNAFFDLVDQGVIKLRIMFTQNMNVKPALDEERLDNEYFMLYYQFVKHAFGLRYWNYDQGRFGNASVAVYIDDPPQNAAKFRRFKAYVSTLSDYPVFSAAGVSIALQDVTGVDSKSHNIMQGLDIVLGAMQSRLNEMHTKAHPPAKRRSKAARAKERVYAAIKDRIWQIYPHFNVGISTGTQTGVEDRWRHPYRHWCFVPTGSTLDRSRGKKK